MTEEKKKTGPGKGNRTRGKDRRGNLEGNRSGRYNAAALIEAGEDNELITEHYKKVAKNRAAVIRYGQPYALTLFNNLNAYIEEKQEQHKPITKAGLIRASGLTTDTYYRYRKGEADHLLYEYMEIHGIDFDREGELITLQPEELGEGPENAIDTGEGKKDAYTGEGREDARNGTQDARRAGEKAEGEKVLLVRLSEVIKMAELAMQEQLEANCYANKGNPLGSIAGMRNYFDWNENPQGSQTTNQTLVIAPESQIRAALDRLG